ncbi:MAG: sulfite exporter TauE/SafE family protein [Gammaproteobacteria bacterium]|nr:sulfite exporter TauE/SafE family protein [Gammaproteobacteria bacterium]
MGTELTVSAAFLVGLLGSTHCIGMCGGIVGALTLGLDDPVRKSSGRLLAFLFAYNSGRILSYTIAGGVSGLLGEQLVKLAWGIKFPVGGIIAGLFMIALGLYLTGWWRMLAVLEKLGARLWKRIEPLGRRLLPVNSLSQAFALGMLWGWLPCGLVYAALAWSLTTANAVHGALLMFGFGLGTLPMLLLMGRAAEQLNRFVRSPRARQIAGLIIIGLGIYVSLSAFQNGPHMHHVMSGVSENSP